MRDVRERDTPPDTDRQAEDTGTRKRERPVTTGTFGSTRTRRLDDQPLDFSPSSTAVDPTDARQDLGEAYVTGRFSYTPNETFIDGAITAKSDVATTLNQFNREMDSSTYDMADGDDEHLESARRRVDLRRDIEGWGRRVGLTDTEIREAVQIVSDVPAGARRNFGLEAVCLGALTIAANQPTHGRHTSKSIRLDGANTNNESLVMNYERLKRQMRVTTQSVSNFRTWYDRNHS